MKSPADSHEITILESKGILIQDQIFHAVLTDRRIILTRYSDNKLSIRSIYFADIQKIEKDTDDSGDPVIILVPSSAKREIKKVGLHFSQKNFPDPHKESSLWASEINKMLRSASRVPPAPVPKKPPVTKAFCVRCGTKCTDGSAFCTKCGTKIIYPAHSLPPRQIDTSVRKGVKIIEIPVEKIELPHKKSSIPNTNDSHKKEKVPVVAPKHKETSFWASEINKSLQSVSRVSPAQLPKKPPVTKEFCITCGTKCTDGSEFCTKCGTKIIYPVQPRPPQQVDTSVRKSVKIIEIPVTKIELPHKKSSIPNTYDSHKKEKVPVVAPKHKEHEKKKSFLPDSENENLH